MDRKVRGEGQEVRGNGNRNSVRPKGLTSVAFSLFAIVVVGTLISWRVPEHRLVQSMYEAKTLPMVEGVVQDFVPGGLDGHTAESFDISGVHFSYSLPVFTGGFHQIHAVGGPMREGLQVRIYYLPGSAENKIVRLEVSN